MIYMNKFKPTENTEYTEKNKNKTSVSFCVFCGLLALTQEII